MPTDQSPPWEHSSPKPSAPPSSKRASRKNTTRTYKNVHLGNLLTGPLLLCRLSIISGQVHSAQDQLVDLSELDRLQLGVMPFSLMTMPLGENYRVSLVVEKRSEPSVCGVIKCSIGWPLERPNGFD